MYERFETGKWKEWTVYEIALAANFLNLEILLASQIFDDRVVQMTKKHCKKQRRKVINWRLRP